MTPFQVKLGVLLLVLGGVAADKENQADSARAGESVAFFPLPRSAIASGDFHLTANGTAVPVEHYRDRHVASFSAAGEVALQIAIDAPITRYSIHPLSFGLKGTVEGNRLKVSLTPTLFNPEPTYLLFKINDLENLVVLVDPPEENVPRPRDPGVQDVTAPPYGADPSGKKLATTAIQSAIDHVAQSGGGIAYVPPGLFRVRSLMLKSGVTLYLAGGAVIQGSNLLADYEDPAAGQGSAGKGLPPVIEARNFKDIAIRGRGWIDAAEGTMRRSDGVAQDVVSRGPYRRGTIRVTDGTGFTLEGIMARDAGTWSVVTDRVENIQITRLKLLGPLWSRNDGIDICGCHAVVDKCFVYTGDDNFCTKALRADFPLHDIHFRNSIGYSRSAGVRAGMEVLSAQSEISFENMDIIHAGRGLVVDHLRGSHKAEKGGLPMHDIFFTDIRVEEVAGTGGTSRNPIQIASDLPGPISHIVFRRVSVGNFGPHPSLISGYDASSPVTDVVFEDLTIGGKPIGSLSAGDFKTKNASGLTFLPSAP